MWFATFVATDGMSQGPGCVIHENASTCTSGRSTSASGSNIAGALIVPGRAIIGDAINNTLPECVLALFTGSISLADRKSTRLNSSHVSISYAVFCLKKKNQQDRIK